ncbi:MAG: PQQ-binding-like beta-propeller repeat protein [Bacteroidia bacterium]|nr:PQQ-binding-like beta-propeller repeat protein [Bacteroidia bacterium]
MRYYYLIICMLLTSSCERPKESYTDFSQWDTYSGDPSGAKYSSLDQINKDNIQGLKPAWVFRTSDMLESPRTQIQCNPIIIGEIMYIISPGLKLIALEAESGKEVWTFDPYPGEKSSGTIRGLTFWDDAEGGKVFYVAGSYLYQLFAQSGEINEMFGEVGRIDLRKGLGREPEDLWVSATSPGIIYGNNFILGTRVGEGPGSSAPGHIRAYNLRSGEIDWTFHTIPQPGEFGYETWPPEAWKESGGANPWGGFSLDEKRGWIFCGTGSAAYDHWGGDRIGDNLFANCILALDAETGKRIWHYQVVHHDIWDYDLASPPNLVQLKKGNTLIDAIAQPTKMGHLFVLDRESGQAIFPIEEVPVPQSRIPGEQTSPTQPFPHKELRYGQQRFTKAEATDLNPESNEEVKARLEEMISGDIFLPPDTIASVTLPQFNGGTDWGGAAYDPVNRLLFVNTSNEAESIVMIPAKQEEGLDEYSYGKRLFNAYCSSCHSMGNATSVPALSHLKEKEEASARAYMDKVFQEGKGQMPAFTTLSKAEKRAIQSFLLELGKEEAVEIGEQEKAPRPWLDKGHQEMKTKEGYPVNIRPWGSLTAIDLDKGKIKWQVPLGTYPELEKKGFPPTGTFNMGGPLVTAGGLVFIGASMDERFHAYDKDTGQLLWEFQLDAGAYASPASFSIGGKQYIVIAAGGGGKPGTKAGNAYYCFALD